MPNPYLSGRIPVELDKQVNEFLARTGETKTLMLIKAVSAYIGAEPPPLKVPGDPRIENLQLEVAELRGALQSLYDKVAVHTSKIENLQLEIKPVSISDNTADNNDNIEDSDKIDQTLTNIEDAIDSNDNSVEIEKTNPGDNIDNKVELSPAADVTPTSDDEKTFIHIETAEAAKLTKLHPKRFTSFRHSYNQKLKKKNQSLPEKQRLDSPIKMTPTSGVKIEKVPYDIFYVGHSEEGRNLWNLVPITTASEDVPLPFATDNT